MQQQIRQRVHNRQILRKNCKHTLIIISGMHHYECIVPNIDINLQSGWFSAKSIASFRERLNDSRSCWIVFIHVVRGRPCGLLQFSRAKLLRSSLHLFCLADAQCGRIGRDTVLGQWPGGVVAQFSGSSEHSRISPCQASRYSIFLPWRDIRLSWPLVGHWWIQWDQSSRGPPFVVGTDSVKNSWNKLPIVADYCVLSLSDEKHWSNRVTVCRLALLAVYIPSISFWTHKLMSCYAGVCPISIAPILERKYNGNETNIAKFISFCFKFFRFVLFFLFFRFRFC